MRQIVLDTETTGLEPSEGQSHNRNRLCRTGQSPLYGADLSSVSPAPTAPSTTARWRVHGITNDFLADKPRFTDVVEDFLEFVRGAELVIHNAPFDVGFLNHELRMLGGGYRLLDAYCSVLDTLALARRLHPGQKNSLDALCKRYTVDNSRRELHGALLDAEILADVYLAMTGGQVSLSLEGALSESGSQVNSGVRRLAMDRPRLRVLHADPTEAAAHAARLDQLDAASGGQCLWRKLEL
jgi:DNA polymerase III subunit epsilon